MSDKIAFSKEKLETSGFILVQWPDSQEYMEEDWFDAEAIPALGSEERTGDSAFFIPIYRIMNL